MENRVNSRTGVWAKKKRAGVTELTLCGVFAAIICVFTMFIQLRIIPAEGGMVHIGNVPLFFFAAYFGKRAGAVAGGVGMMLSDLLSGWGLYAPITLPVVALMGFVVGAIVRGRPTFLRLIAASAGALAIKVAGYYIGEVFLFHSFVIPLASIPGNVIQIVTGAIIAVPLILAARPVMARLIRKDGGQQDSGREDGYV